MQQRRIKRPRLPNEEQIQSLMGFARNEGVQTSMARLMDTPEEWDQAMTDPAAWLQAQGLEVPEGLSAAITKEITISKPLDPGTLGMPGPDWFPYEIRFTNCRTFLVETKDNEGKITGYHIETVCFGMEIVWNRQPGPVG